MVTNASKIRSSDHYWIKVDDEWKMGLVSITRIPVNGQRQKYLSVLFVGSAIPSFLPEDSEVQGPIRPQRNDTPQN